MKSITKVKIGPIVFDVVRVVRLTEAGTNKRLAGYLNQSNCCIDLDADMHPQAELLTVWHETIHAILSQNGLEELACNEALIEVVTWGVMQVIEDNPQLADIASYRKGE